MFEVLERIRHTLLDRLDESQLRNAHDYLVGGRRTTRPPGSQPTLPRHRRVSKVGHPLSRLTTVHPPHFTKYFLCKKAGVESVLVITGPGTVPTSPIGVLEVRTSGTRRMTEPEHRARRVGGPKGSRGGREGGTDTWTTGTGVL